MNGLEQLQWNLREYSLDPTDDLVRFWRSKVKVAAGYQGGRGIQVDTGRQSACSSYIVFHAFKNKWVHM